MTESNVESRPKNIVSVVFEFNFETMTPIANAQEYAYYFRGPIEVGDVALVMSPRKGLTGVLVTNTSPSPAAIRRVTKSLIGKVDLSVYEEEMALWATAETEAAWDRYGAAI